MNKRLQAKRATFSNFQKCIVIKNSKYSSRVVQKCAPQIQDGRWLPSWKKLKIITF